MTDWLGLIVVAPASAALTGLLRKYAIARKVMDLPTERSLHVAPTPRGGGVAIVVTFVAGAVVLWMTGRIGPSVAVALLGAGALVGLAGFIDDHGHLAVSWRLAMHFLAAGWGLYWLGGLPPLSILGRSVEVGWPGAVIAVVALVWLLNLYNFMDGIDGIAGIQAVTAGCGATFLILRVAPEGGAWELPAILALSAFGFLLWNWPPAKIFMGDAGSGFLGLTMGLLLVHSGWIEPRLLWSWTVLLGVFVVDATVTLTRRVWRGQKSYLPHRTHAYQHAATRYGHHAVTLAVGAISTLWLWPIAGLVAVGILDGLLGVSIAYLPLIVVSFWHGAGLPASAAGAGVRGETLLRIWGSRITPPNLNRWLAAGLLRAGWMGAEERRFFESVVTPGQVVVDIGANQGVFTLLLSRLVGASGRVLAFEPEPDLFAALQRNCRRNAATNVTPFRCALGATAGPGVLHCSRFNSGDNRLSDSVKGPSKPVEIRTLDEVLGSSPVDLIKIDAQGYEGHIAAGMAATLMRCRAVRVVFEYWPQGLGYAGSDPAELLTFFQDRGFSLYRFSGTALTKLPAVAPATAIRLADNRWTTLLATRDSITFPR